LIVVCGLASLPVADDRRLSTHWAPTWQLLQADPSYPGTVLSSVGGHEIKRITAGVKACRWVLPARIRPVTGLHPPGVLNIKRKKNNSVTQSLPSLKIGRYKRTYGQRQNHFGETRFSSSGICMVKDLSSFHSIE
jgi:hypothetical protein